MADTPGDDAGRRVQEPLRRGSDLAAHRRAANGEREAARRELQAARQDA